MVKNRMRTPTLKTDRLILRQLKKPDVIEIFQLFSNPNVMKYDGGFVLQDISQAEDYIYSSNHQDGGYTWAFFEKKTGKLVGTGGIKNWYGGDHAEVGLVIAEQFWNNHYGREALQKIIQFCFEQLKLAYVYAATLPENKPAIRLVERLGFQFQGMNHNYWLANQYVKAMVFIKKNKL